MSGVQQANGHVSSRMDGHHSENRFDPLTSNGSDGNSHQLSQPGLLWRTIFRSPCVNWILPGAIGRADRTSVAFIGEDYVELKEWDRKHERLFTVAVANDFPAKIISAQLLGERRTSRNVINGDRMTTNDDDTKPLHSPQVLVLLLDNSTLALLRAEEQNG